MEGNLQGVRVIDWTNWLSGPLATMMLAEMGAEVIKVEHPVTGDPARGTITLVGQSTQLPGGKTVSFESYNLSKKGICVDATTDRGREIICRLVEKSDVFVQNFRPGTAEKLGLTYATLRERNPRLVYASCTPLGSQGPAAKQPGMDLTAQARAGLLTFWEDAKGALEPHHTFTGFGDDGTAYVLLSAILSALLARERTGRGQEVEVSQFAAMLALQHLRVSQYLATGHTFHLHQRDQAGNPIFNLYRCRDGKWVVLGMTQSERFWPAFCRVIDRPDLERDPRFEGVEQREEHRKELIHILDGVFAEKDSDEWAKLLGAAALFLAPVNTVEEAIADPHVPANGHVMEVEHPTLGSMKVLRLPFLLGGTVRIEAAPEFGQHTEEVLAQLCDYNWDELQVLKTQGVIN